MGVHCQLPERPTMLARDSETDLAQVSLSQKIQRETWQAQGWTAKGQGHAGQAQALPGRAGFAYAHLMGCMAAMVRQREGPGVPKPSCVRLAALQWPSPPGQRTAPCLLHRALHRVSSCSAWLISS